MANRGLLEGDICKTREQLKYKEKGGLPARHILNPYSEDGVGLLQQRPKQVGHYEKPRSPSLPIGTPDFRLWSHSLTGTAINDTGTTVYL